jgi:hypothetical protein
MEHTAERRKHPKERRDRDMEMRKQTLNKTLVGVLLLASAVVVSLSGLVLQQEFHRIDKIDLAVHLVNLHRVGSEPMRYEQLRGIDTGRIAYGFDYHAWSAIHRSAVVLFSLLIAYHAYFHRKWYAHVIGKHLARKNGYIITLSALFLPVAMTGFASWLIDSSNGRVMLRIAFIEIHDKIALILSILLIPHVVKRIKTVIPGVHISLDEKTRKCEN